MDLAECTVFKTLKTCNADYNQVVIKSAFQNCFTSLMISILKSGSEVCESFEAAKAQTVIWEIVVLQNPRSIFINSALLCPATKAAVETIKLAAARLVKHFLLLPYHCPSFDFCFLLIEMNKRREKRNS